MADGSSHPEEFVVHGNNDMGTGESETSKAHHAGVRDLGRKYAIATGAVSRCRSSR
jgi:hypothetical protein